MKNEESLRRAKDTGLALVLILLLFSYLTHWTGLIFPGICLLILSMTWPRLFSPAAGLWFGFSNVLGNVISKISLTALFFTIVSSVGMIRRIFGSDSMRLKAWKEGTGSLLVHRDHIFTASDLEKPF